MEILSNDTHRILLCQIRSRDAKQLDYREYFVKVDNIDTTSTNNLLLWILIAFILVTKTEYDASEQWKKWKRTEATLQMEHEELSRQNGEFRMENEKLQKEIDDRKAQFENGWQQSFLFPGVISWGCSSAAKYWPGKHKVVSLIPDWRKKYYQPVTVTLDPDTAHPALILSEERRRVAMGEKCLDLPKSQLRFESLPCVLGQQSFSSERHFWEVKVDSSTAWDLGICRSNVMCTERTYIKPEDGFWAIRFYNDEYWALTSPETQLTVKQPPRMVCIFLDYEDRCVSFYNMTDNSHIHTFSQGDFYGSLKPFFRLWSKDSGHLDICPLPKEPEVAQLDDNPNSPPTDIVHT
ncbi:butyrophilin subfamily 1 member A1-like isoform X3 [Cavia porcellus]|uniref:butyrophilin subfamily 1 member A1-like isoform X3 n=1 Tax=Cavia porcellus TaxID=10141 RepID=UPI002FDFE5F2